MEMYRHVELVQGTTHQVAWIPRRGARVGALVELKDDSGLWRVASVGDHEITETEASSNRDAYRTQRKASDI